MSRVPLTSSLYWRSKQDKYGPSLVCLATSRFLPILQASDLATTSRILITIVTLSKNSGDWNLLNDQVLLLSKKHGQLKQAVTKMVQTVMGFLDETPNLDVKLSVIHTLRTVTEGKVSEITTRPAPHYANARLYRSLSKSREPV